MKVLKVEFSEKFPTEFYIYVWAPDEYRWKERHYAFKYEDGEVYYLFGGQEKDKRLAGHAQTKEEAIQEATKYLESWLRECGAID